MLLPIVIFICFALTGIFFIGYIVSEAQRGYRYIDWTESAFYTGAFAFLLSVILVTVFLIGTIFFDNSEHVSTLEETTYELKAVSRYKSGYDIWYVDDSSSEKLTNAVIPKSRTSFNFQQLDDQEHVIIVRKSFNNVLGIPATMYELRIDPSAIDVEEDQE